MTQSDPNNFTVHCMTKIHPKRVLLKLSGEALSSPDPLTDCPDSPKSFGISQQMLVRIAKDIKAAHDKGIEICLVVGGGNIFRGLQGQSNYNLDRTISDHMGMLATVINGLALRSAIESLDVPCRLMSALPMNTVAQLYVQQRAIRHIEKGRVMILVAGTGNPYFTTDTAATLRAIELKCDMLLKATKFDGIYDKDPAKHNDVKLYSNLSYDDVIAKNITIMDTTALTLGKENGLELRIFSIYQPNGLLDVIQNKGTFTKVV
jgi:uridylate kinase